MKTELEKKTISACGNWMLYMNFKKLTTTTQVF